MISTMNRQAGFNILEMMVAIAIAGVISVLAVPAFGDLLKNNRLATQANDMINSLHYARSEAVNRGRNIRIEPLTAGATWTTGWRVCIDANTDNDCADVSDIILRNYDRIEGASLVSSQNSITYRPAGDIDAATTLTLTANKCTREHIRTISLLVSGHPNLTRNACP